MDIKAVSKASRRACVHKSGDPMPLGILLLLLLCRHNPPRVILVHRTLLAHLHLPHRLQSQLRLRLHLHHLLQTYLLRLHHQRQALVCLFQPLVHRPKPRGRRRTTRTCIQQFDLNIRCSITSTNLSSANPRHSTKVQLCNLQPCMTDKLVKCNRNIKCINLNKSFNHKFRPRKSTRQ